MKKYLKKIKKSLIHYKNFLIDHNSKLMILVYHRVLKNFKDNSLDTIISLNTFKKQIELLSQKYSIISLSDAVKQCRTGSVKSKNQVVLTFDDGYWDNYDFVYPLLKEKGIKAVFFPSTDFVGKDRVINSLREKTEPDRCMNWNQLREMSEAGMEIGSHAMSHSSLAMLPYEEAKKEITESKRIIEENIKNECKHFSYPYGSTKDYNQDLIFAVKNAGFESCLLNIHGYNHFKKDNFCFKRIIMTENTNLNYLLG